MTTSMDIITDESLTAPATEEEIKEFAEFLIKENMTNDSLEDKIKHLKEIGTNKMAIKFTMNAINESKK